MSVAGLGFTAWLLGLVLAGSIVLGIAPRLATLPGFFQQVVAVLSARLWLLAVLPAFAYALARAIDLKPMSTAVGAGLSGELFDLLFGVAQGGLGALVANVSTVLVRLATLGVGIALTWWAVTRARGAAARAQARALERARESANQYQAFADEAARLAALQEGRSAVAGESAGESAASKGAAPEGEPPAGGGG